MKGDTLRAVPENCHHVTKVAYNLRIRVPYVHVLLYVSVICAFSLSRSISVYRYIIVVFNPSRRHFVFGFFIII